MLTNKETTNKLISFCEVERQLLNKYGKGFDKATLKSYQKLHYRGVDRRFHEDGKQIFPDARVVRRGNFKQQGALYDKAEAMEGADRIIRHRTKKLSDKILAATRKNKADADERSCKQPANFELAFKLMNKLIKI